ncbi:unnamed protein product [Amoebophrya sp. A25]|nr:unnamed protein product [Amoebophrya sp. A25]|eukprot:GSA25T00021695001.1
MDVVQDDETAIVQLHEVDAAQEESITFHSDILEKAIAFVKALSTS